jgi:hypothetical protein
VKSLPLDKKVKAKTIKIHEKESELVSEIED